MTAPIKQGSDINHPQDKLIRKDIQGLRAIAVLAVIVFHVNDRWLPGGFIGVDIFFVISGFIITSIVLEQKQTSSFGFVRFYWGRFKRIIPACFVMLGAVSLAASVLFLPEDFGFYVSSLTSAVFFASNMYFAGFSDYFAPGTHELPLLHTWSLAVEMQFYLILPLILLWLPLRWLKILLPCVVLVLTAYIQYQLRFDEKQQQMYFSLLARIPEFLLGVIAAAYRTQAQHLSRLFSIASYIGVALIALSLGLINESHKFPGAIALIPCIGVALILLSRNTFIERLLSSGILVWIGGISYSLYLWHWPILAFARYYEGQYSLNAPWVFFFFLITFLIAWLSFKYVEEPIRKTGSYIAFAKVASVPIVGTVLLLFLASLLNTRVADPLSVDHRQYASPNEICHGNFTNNCIRGVGAGEPRTLLVGDSHGAQLNHFFDVVGKHNNFNIRIMTASSCMPFPGFDVERLPEEFREKCVAQIIQTEKYTDSSDTIVFAGMWSTHSRSAEFIAAFDEQIKRLNGDGKRVLVMAQVPMFKTNIRRLQRFNSLGLTSNLEYSDEWVVGNDIIKVLIQKYPSAQFVDFSNSEFFMEAPFYKSALLYGDSHHLNKVGALSYGEFASSYFKQFSFNESIQDM